MRGLQFVKGAVLVVACMVASGTVFAQDSRTSLLLTMENTLAGAQGEAPVQASGVSYEGGASGTGAYFAIPNNVQYSASGNILATEGTLEFWMKPRWSGSDGQTYGILKWGDGGGMLFAKDGANNLRSIFNRYSAGGKPERGVAMNVGAWIANQWHYVAYTWSGSGGSLKMYIDGSLVSQTGFTGGLPAIANSTFQIGGDGAGTYLNAVLDELRISSDERSATEIGQRYISGLPIHSLKFTPPSLDILQTWNATPTLTGTTDTGSIPIPSSAAAWTTTDGSIARVDTGGVVHAVSPGDATLTASVSGLSANLPVKVRAPIRPPQVDVIDPFLATPASGYLYEMPVAIIRYLPTLDGVNVDSATADWVGPLTSLKASIDQYDLEVKYMLEEGSRFRGYKDKTAKPSLGYRVVAVITVYEPLPPDTNPSHSPGGGVYFPDYYQILTRFNARHLVEDLGVKEFWLWGYHHGNIVPAESDMSSPTTGDISNSYRYPDDLPIFHRTYTLYNYNFTRSSNEAVHDHGHQLESILSYVAGRQDGNSNLFWRSWTGRNSSDAPITGRCGNTHMPPNTTADYDYYNTTLVSSDIEDWTPAHNGAQKLVNANTWGSLVYSWPYNRPPSDLTQHQYYMYWMQAMPGRDNTIPNGANRMTNWWKFTGDWDASVNAITSTNGLYAAGNTVAPTITQQPTSRSVAPGSPTTFIVRATGTGSLTYRWRKGGLNLSDDEHVSGTTTDTLDISSVAASDAGTYDVVIQDGSGLIDSARAALSVLFTTADAIRALNVAGGLSMVGAEERDRLDVASSGTVDVRDATGIMRKAAGLDANP